LTNVLQPCTVVNMDEQTEYYATRYHTTREAAAILHVSEATLRRWVHSKPPRIRADKTVSGQYLFTDEYIDEARPRPVEHRAQSA
jgi:excisionase family DNA binding protein